MNIVHEPMRVHYFFRLSAAVLSFSLFSGCPGVARAEVNFRQDLSATVYDVRGNEARSFYRGDRANYLYEGLMDFREKTGEASEVYGNVLYRLTDDRLVDRQALSLKQLTVGYRDKSVDIVAGLAGDVNISGVSIRNIGAGDALNFRVKYTYTRSTGQTYSGYATVPSLAASGGATGLNFTISGAGFVPLPGDSLTIEADPDRGLPEIKLGDNLKTVRYPF